MRCRAGERWEGRCRRGVPSLLAVFAVVLLGLQRFALGHGYMQVPAARSLGNKGANAYCQQCGNGLGNRSGGTYPPGICGDPFQGTSSNFAGGPGPIRATYSQGQTVDVQAILTANHGGRFRVKMCPDVSSSATQSCFDSNTLKRKDTGATDYWLLTGSYGDSPPYSMQYILPAGVACSNGCLLQWEYTAMQSCVVQCPQSECGPYANRSNPITGSVNMNLCPPTLTGPGGAEVFRNCADIRISSGGSNPTPAPAATMTRQPTVPTNCVNASPDECSAWGPSSCIYSGVSAKCAKMCGTCTGTPSSVPAPAPTRPPPSTPVAAPGGSCGPSANAHCPSPQCCSQWGWCGVTSDHCGSGCQRLWGTCSR
ncbi:hypothetical protein JKP88DRAFT_195219 [Tribonema minus]|uniref:Chitin-binding type-1 domain-containing protein n=1 Tax=Tribonema minus TaxID=303371 RepID=A0A836CFM7_9STRA|nr:hypothetical protein JKP88DRAFT_195355 [Tribonema minus]KAG5182338.1 hypothetical protein JKP88DRAFT_195300 [Tribonema minus]KAG5183458.1 hypothetical protein JKP88DRAFT_195219 [Tribonema minus]